MLATLSIQNFILIENLCVDFAKNFTVISGESGAGKSVLFSALQFILGRKIDKKIALDSTKPVVLSALFDIANISDDFVSLLFEQDLIAEGCSELCIRRVVSPEGRSRFFVNDSLVTLSQITILAEYLVEICGQHDQRFLLDNRHHMRMVDEFASLNNDVINLRKIYSEWKSSENTLAKLEEQMLKNKLEQEYMTHDLKEFQEMALTEDEEEKLTADKVRLRQEKESQDIMRDFLTNATSYDDGIGKYISYMAKISSRLPESFNEIKGRIENIRYEFEDIVNEMQNYYDKIEFNDAALNAIEERLSRIKSLARKHNIDSKKLFEKFKEIEERLNIISNFDDDKKILSAKCAELKQNYITLAKHIRNARLKAASDISKAVINELQHLAMQYISFKVDVVDLEESKWNEYGTETMKFMISINSKMQVEENFQNLSTIASGGELSRLMLALKIALSTVKSFPVVIFDEIDVGVSGAMATKIGQKLQQLATSSNAINQVFVVTHQPQVAVFGHNHIIVKKILEGNTVCKMCVKQIIEQDDRVTEIARMISGENISQEAMLAAKKLIHEAM